MRYPWIISTIREKLPDLSHAQEQVTGRGARTRIVNDQKHREGQIWLLFEILQKTRSQISLLSWSQFIGPDASMGGRWCRGPAHIVHHPHLNHQCQMMIV